MRTSEFRGLTACLMLGAASPCFAQGRPDSTTMSCQAAARLVATRGAVVLGSGPSTYDRYVRDAGFCTRDEEARPAFVPSADNRQCFIGYYCFPKQVQSK